MRNQHRYQTHVKATLIALFFNCVFGCASKPLEKGQSPALRRDAPTAPCSIQVPEQYADAIHALDMLSNLMEGRCFKEALHLGSRIRATYREKEYSIMTEFFSVFVPDSATSEYVLESFERAYLSFLMASAYSALGETDEAAVELRQSYNEGRALLYNYGEDPVNIALLATLWENFGQVDHARPFWKRLSGMLPEKSEIAVFAQKRIAAIDRGEKRLKRWRIFALGRFPRMDWTMSFSRGSSGYYLLKPTGPAWPNNCRSETGIVLSTASWGAKLGSRYSSDYHPLLHMKSWVRLPIGITYGLVTAAAGVGLAVGGCGLASYGKSDEACKFFVKAGMAIASKSADVADFALAPDLRHWQMIPAAIMITEADRHKDDRCTLELAQEIRSIGFEFTK